MTPEQQATYAVVDLAVQRFARKCKEHPRIEEDPICVIATVAEEYSKALREDIMEQVLIEPETHPELKQANPKPSKTHTNGNGRTHVHTRR